MHLPAQRRRQLAEKSAGFEQQLEPVLPYLLGRGLSAEAAQRFHLGSVPPGQEFASRLSIPYVTPGGVVQIKYRCTKPDHHEGLKHVADCPKYLYEAGCGAHLYNAQVLISAADTVIITEGELDALCVQAYTGIPAVGYPGTEHWLSHPHFRLCFEAVSEVIVVADGEDAGRKSAARVAESIGSYARVVDMPDNEDASSFIASQGASAFIERVNQ